MARHVDDEIGDFDESPRPAKRRKKAPTTGKNARSVKVTKKATRTARSDSTTSRSVSIGGSDYDDDFETIAKKSNGRRSRGVTESDQEERNAVKKPKHKFKIVADDDFMQDQFLTQAPDRSPSPDGIRGAIWLKGGPGQASIFNRPAPSPVSQPSRASTSHEIASKPNVERERPVFKAPSKPIEKNISSNPGHGPSIAKARSPLDQMTTASSDTAIMASAVARDASTAPRTQVYDVSHELEDLPSDAFSFSSPERSPARPTDTTPQAQPVVRKVQNVQAPRSGLQQTTLFGALATQSTDKEVPKSKKLNFPKPTQPEPPTHHKLNQEALSTWVYPVNLGTIREYQYSIVSAALYNNLLVALPTGLGKTFIAATVMLNWFRWTKESQIVFLAPTKPLVAQQVDACFHIVGIPRSQTVMLTGGISPGLRAEEWREKRVFFMTPQTMINDLKTGSCDPKRIVLIVVDEAHRATGSYSYVEVVKFIRRFNSSFRVLALTATPGAKVETVQQVIDGLDIAKIEIRTEQSLDIRQYVHLREVDTYLFDYSSEQEMIMDLCSKAIKPVLDKLNSQNAYWVKDPIKLTAFGLTIAQRDWNKSEAGRKAPQAVKGMLYSIFSVLATLAHAIALLKFHGIGPFFRSVMMWKDAVDGGQTKGKYAQQIRKDDNFVKMLNCMQGWSRNADFVGHPKLEHLRTVILNHFMDAGEGAHGDNPPSATRVMVFAQWRDSAEEITRVLRRNEPMIRPHVFVGQADAKGSEGMDQKKQLEVIQQFKDGKYNTLVATSIGEEGLDIGEVDLIICYDANASPIRMLQRMGRTGRKRKGNIAILLMRDKEEKDWIKAKDNYEAMQAMIAKGDRFQYHEDRSPRILPREVRPVVDKKVVEIPPENSQADLPEPKKSKRKPPKRPPKKFHMPDGVQTGFVKASRIDGDDDEEDEDDLPRSKSKKCSTTAVRQVARPVSPPPVPAPLPFLQDVLLNKIQERELERKFQYVNAKDSDAIISAPRPDNFPEAFRDLGRTKYVGHGRLAVRTAAMMQRMHDMNEDSVQKLRDNLVKTDLQMSHDLDTFLSSHPLSDAPFQAPDPDTKAMPPPARTPQTRRPRKSVSKPATKSSRVSYRASAAAEEGESSSPEPTPADMRIATQGIDLGSSDTSGEDEMDGEPDSELADFVVGSDQPIEYASSSQPASAAPHRSLYHIFSSQGDGLSQRTDDSLPEISVIVQKKNRTSGGEDVSARQRKRRNIIDDDSDDE